MKSGAVALHLDVGGRIWYRGEGRGMGKGNEEYMRREREGGVGGRAR